MNNPTSPYFTAALYFEIITAGIANEKPVCAQQFAKKNMFFFHFSFLSFT